MSKTAIIIQARMGSKRLPGKTLKSICKKPMLAHLIERLNGCKEADDLVIATSINRENDPIQKVCLELKTKLYRGSEEDVLSRYIEAASFVQSDMIVRITGDCPLISPEIVDLCIIEAKKKRTDLLAATTIGGFPRGLDCEVVKLSALKKIYDLDHSRPAKEHVTWGIYQKPELFYIEQLTASIEYNYPTLRLCVDEKNDFELVNKIYNALYKELPISTLEMFNFLNSHSDLMKINAKVKQKTVGS